MGSWLPTAAHVRSRSATLTLALTLLLATIAGLGLLEATVVLSAVPRPPIQATFFPVLGLVYAGAGTLAWSRRPRNHTGALLMAGGLVWIAAGLVNAPEDPLAAVGLITQTIGLAVLVHLLLAFPSGRLRRRAAKITVLSGYGVCILLQAPLYLFADGPLAVARRPGLAQAGLLLQDAVGTVVMIATAALLIGRLRRLRPPQRRSVGLLYAYAVLAVLWVALSGQAHALFGLEPLVRFDTQMAAVAGVALAFVLATFRGGFARTAELQELAALLGAQGDSSAALEAGVAQALGDPSLALQFWIAERGTYVDLAGDERELPDGAGGRGVVEVEARGRRIGAIVYDAALISDVRYVHGAARIVALARERQRLTVALQASEKRLRASRVRVAYAADTERRRIARDLHDGLQTTLVMLALRAYAVREKTRGLPGVEAETLYLGLQDAISELRTLAHGVVPALLTERGLGAAVQALADVMPIPTRVEIEPAMERAPGPVESAGYFVISEALTNAVKHADASHLRVRVARSDGQLEIEISDDGSGGADTAPHRGLQGLEDRVEALDGSLRIDSPVGVGTRLTVQIPCA